MEKQQEPTSSVPLMLEFSRLLDGVDSRQDVAEKFLTFLQQIGCGDSIWLFLRNREKKEFSMHTSYMIRKHKEIMLHTETILADFANESAWRLEIRNRTKTTVSENFFPSGFDYAWLAPILSGDRNLGVLKVDRKHQTAPSGERKELIELGCLHFAHRWAEIEGRELLRDERRAYWFDDALLEMKSCGSATELHHTIREKLDKLNKIDPNLHISWKYYYQDQQGGIFTSDLTEHGEGGKGQFNRNIHYDDTSHIANFINSHQDAQYYGESELKHLNFGNFRVYIQAVICFKTGLKRYQIRGLGGEQDDLVIEIGSYDTVFLSRNQERFQGIVDQFINTANAIQMEVSDSTVDERYLHQTREIIAQLLHKESERDLVQFLLNKALSLVPDAEAASYGKITLAGDSPTIEIHDSLGSDPQYSGAHMIQNEGVWQYCWETKESVMVNNQYDVGGLKITESPIERPQSALCVPLFDAQHRIKGMINLCSSQINVFQRVHSRMLEWLAHGFSAQLRAIYAQNKEGINSSSQVSQKGVVPCIKKIIQLFSEAEFDAPDYDRLFRQAIKEVVDGIDHASWVLLERHSDSYYEVIQHDRFNLVKRDLTHHLPSCPVVTELFSGQVPNIMEGAIRTNRRFTKLLPLLDTGTRSCLAVPVLIERSVQEPPEQRERARKTSTYGLFLFHSITERYGGSDLDFLHIAISLIQELMKQQALKEEFERLIPLSISGSMAAQVAHEIRNPCQPISNFVSIINKQLQDTARYRELLVATDFVRDSREMVDIAQKSLERIDLNVTQLINLSDIGHIRYAPVSIEEVFNDVSSYRWYLGGGDSQLKSKPITISIVRPQQRLPRIRFDKYQLATILTNLIRNAFQAIVTSSHAEGTIRLGAELIEDDEYPLRIHVKDEGPGIPVSIKKSCSFPSRRQRRRERGWVVPSVNCLSVRSVVKLLLKAP